MRLISLVALVAVVALAAPDAQEMQAQGESFLKQLDAHAYAETWTGASKMFQSQISQDKWVDAMKSVREPLGALVSRKFLRMNLPKAVPGAPDGQYAVLQFQTAFSEKAEAIETVTFLQEDGKWKLAGFFIR
jgi:hypothetical protein